MKIFAQLALCSFLFIASSAYITSASYAASAASTGFQSAQASEFALPVPKNYGTFSHPVIFAATAVRFKEMPAASSEIDGYIAVRQNIVVQWGTSVFEIVRLAYLCDLSKTNCELDDGVRLATYKSCEVNESKVACKGLISSESNTSESGVTPEFEETYETESTSQGEDFPDRTVPNNLGGLSP